MSRTVAVVLVALFLSGCIGDEAGDGSGTTVAEEEGLGPAGNLTLPAMTQATEVIVFTETGNLGPTDTCTTECHPDVYSLTAAMEPDTAYAVEAVLSSTPASTTFDPVYMYLSAEAGIRDFEGVDYSGSDPRITATLLAQGGSEVFLNVAYNGLVSAEGGDYTLTVTMTPLQDTIPTYAPAAVKVPAGGQLKVGSASGPGSVLLLGGNDEALGVFDVDRPRALVNATEVSTEYVIVTLNGTQAKASVILPEGAPDPVLRHLPVAIEWRDITEINGGGPQSWAFDLPTPPLQAAYRFGAGCVPDDCYETMESQSELWAPAGEVLASWEWSCTLCGGYRTVSSDFGDPALTAGTYEIHWDSTETRGVELSAWTSHYVR